MQHRPALGREDADGLNGANGSPDHRLNQVDATLLDVIAQIEAMLRCGRALQKGVLRLRIAAAARPGREKALRDVRLAAEQIERHYREAADVVRELRTAADALTTG